MPKIQIKNIVVPFVWAIILILNFRNFFFWDTIQLVSKHANFFFENNFSSFFLPEEMDSGHPPFYGMMMALWWNILGRSLWSSHLLNFIFVLGFIYQAHQLGKQVLGKEKAYLIVLCIFANPIFLGHSILVSPDNLLMFILVWIFNCILEKKNLLTAILLTFMSMISMRGMMAVFGIFIGEIIYNNKYAFSFIIQLLKKYIPAGLFAFSFFLIHYLRNEWIGFHNDSPWAESFESVTICNYFYNLGIIAWRFLDFGNVFIVIPILILIRHKFLFKIPKQRFIYAMLVGFGIIFIFPLASFKYLTAHRYFMPIYLLLTTLFIYYISNYSWKVYVPLFILLFSGNFWVYPRYMSQGWDVSLAHIPFYHLTKEMNKFVEINNIDHEKIGTAFPLKSDVKYLYLDPDHPQYHEFDLNRDDYILYSKVMNDFKEKEFERIIEEFHPIKELHLINIDLILYERN